MPSILFILIISIISNYFLVFYSVQEKRGTHSIFAVIAVEIHLSRSALVNVPTEYAKYRACGFGVTPEIDQNRTARPCRSQIALDPDSDR